MLLDLALSSGADAEVAGLRRPERGRDRGHPLRVAPRRALDAMPPDGGLLYVVLTDGAGEEPLRPSGEQVLRRPERPYECMGLSRRVSWTEHGHDLLANLYLGPEASAQRRAELAQAFDSLVVRK